MSSYAIIRFPGKKRYTLMMQRDGEPAELTTYVSLNGRSGFVVAPFCIDHDSPLLLLQPDFTDTFPAGTDTIPPGIRDEINRIAIVNQPVFNAGCTDENGRDAYSHNFEEYHSRLASGEFHKIVLARCRREITSNQPEPAELFIRACESYPRMFVALVSTPRSGTWLTATPEILLEGGQGHWNTIALAGTMKLEGTALEHFDVPMKSRAEHVEAGMLLPWSEKNIQEQRYVSSYIRNCLERFTTDIAEEGPYTARAGGLVHLRSDFHFSLMDDNRIGDLVNELHPTPAVCGLPKDETFRFILNHEHTPRTYYSGFIGTLNINGSTNLYVSLRCMRIGAGTYDLYAGGGLLRDSIENQEWEETEAKMGTMRKILGNVHK